MTQIDWCVLLSASALVESMVALVILAVVSREQDNILLRLDEIQQSLKFDVLDAIGMNRTDIMNDVMNAVGALLDEYSKIQRRYIRRRNKNEQ